jgi:hypothetical protein
MTFLKYEVLMPWKRIESADTISLIIVIFIGMLILLVTNLFIFGVF